LATAVEDVEELSGLAEELLVLAKSSDHPQIHERVRVDELVRAALRLAEGGASEAGVEVDLTGSPSALGAEVCGHRSTLVRCLRNVLDNAIQHGGAGRQVHVRVREAASTVEIVVEDQGPGIDPEDAASVFAPFFRGRRARASAPSGAGLGLALAERGLGEHGGTLRLDPSYSEGARFIASLPKAPEPSPGAEQA
jgi:two-component system OmpR family sensor kinase